ncbi:MAG: 2-oxoacid:acceptor oxidoreductase family protein [Candidatus Methanomethylicia archaeon]|nr:2-oxoacid:acceptor oxidoreductase family protein [Candidatus Methanomethylicia archaeon]MCX8169275.1 2-oxoacid:acceptor oxidoreductase family protein [Candidatus Methanomethylicia archaeon]MDW7988943.1 2-oxoacid:acceptor oxidoreductase family protein [Nitrososphaerota archaeon]
MLEIVWHGRGGQGVWTASNLLAQAALKEGKYVQSFPTFGPERMGAPVMAFTRINDEPIELHCGIYEPNVVIVLDDSLLQTVPVTQGLKDEGKIIVNSKDNYKRIAEIIKAPRNSCIYTTPATDIAIEVIGRPITNTAMIGAFLKVVNIVSLNSVREVIMERFPLKIAELNIKVIEKSYEKTEGGKIE